VRVSTPLRLTTAAIAPISFAVVSLTLLRSNNWSLWGVDALPAKTPATVSFGDLANITATADCLANQVPIDTCDPYGRPFQPYVELPAQVLNAANLGTNNTELLGIGLAVIFFLTIAILTTTVAVKWTKSTLTLLASQALIALMAISPASMLAVERGQLEQLTLALVVLALLAFTIPATSKRAKLRYAGTIASLIATATKYLSIGMFLPFIHRSIFTKANLPVILGGALSAAFAIISIPNILLATETSGAGTPQTTKSAFAVTTLLATLYSGENISYGPTAEVVDNWNTITIASYALFILTTLIWSFALTRKPRTQATAQPRNNVAWVLTLGGGGVLLFPYLLGNSHDYRLIFLIPLTAGAVLLSNTRATIGTLLAICAGIAAATSAAMVPLPNGFIWNTPALVIGDAALMIALAGVAALWITTFFTQQKAAQP
jgi:hypothetical protein